MHAQKDRIGEGLADAPARLGRRKAAVDAHIGVLGVRLADVDHLALGIHKARGHHIPGLVRFPAPRDVDDGAGLDRDAGTGSRRDSGNRAVVAGSGDGHAPALGEQLRGRHSHLIIIALGRDQRRADPRDAVRSHPRESRVHIDRGAVQETIAIGRGVGQFVLLHRTNSDGVARGGYDDIGHAGGVDDRACVDEDLT